MPSINAIKNYQEGGFYHVYNRGDNREIIFPEDEDYGIIDYLLNRYLTNLTYLKSPKNYYGKIKLHAYCFMPNHIHMILEQAKSRDMVAFMTSFSTSLCMIINKKYKKIGHLFQGVYKARLLGDDTSLLTIANYIHENPIDICSNIWEYPYSSLRHYYRNTNIDYLTKDRILGIDPAYGSIPLEG